MLSDASKQRRHQPYTGRFGQPFQSPRKRRNYKQQKQVKPPLGYARIRQALQAQLKTAQAGGAQSGTPDWEDEEEMGDGETAEAEEGPSFLPDTGLSAPGMDWEANDPGDDIDMAPEVEPTSSPPKTTQSSPSKSDKTSFHTRWTKLLPTLVPHFLKYYDTTVGKPLSVPTKFTPTCLKNCSQKTYQVTCLFFDHADQKSVNFCSCEGVVPVLVKNGLFPGAPSQPHVAISIVVLDFYQALFERSCDAVNALVAALITHYRRRGFPIRSANGREVDDGFRKTVTEAICWYDHLGRLVEDEVKQAVKDAGKHLSDKTDSLEATDPVHEYLESKCPACFGGAFGSSISEGCDIHVCVDGCFSHRRLKHAGNPPHPHVPEHYVSKEEVDEVGANIDKVRKKPAKARKIVVPDEAIDECEDGHIAGTGTKVKTDPERYDDTGTMALLCRHDIPILLANIDTPGEQQKYAVTLIQKLYSMLPQKASVAVFYDIGCVLDRSLQLYDILPDSTTSRTTFATSAMHSYVHQWACQLAYNPRFRDGLGLSDGEGVERYWSRMRKIIGICRSSGRKRRLWLIDRLTHRIAADSRDHLGAWMNRRYHDVESRMAKYKLKLTECGIPESELRELWKEQRAAQLSIRAHVLSKLKKDLDRLIAIQGDLDRIENTIKEATLALSRGPRLISSLKDLTAVYEELSSKLDTLYASLNITESFPALRGLPFDVVHKLLLARDLKINIRKRAIGSFFENKRLEQASGGRNETLGTKEHQKVRAAIAKWKPPFLSVIRRFNKLCAELKELLKPEWNIPVPESLPTDVHKLRTKSHIMEDVWIEQSVGQTPRWIESPEVRQGIRAMLSLDCCREERVRLGKEGDNMCRWFGSELTKTRLAMANPDNAHILRHLEAYETRLLLCEPKWSGSQAVSKLRYQHHLSASKEKAQSVAHSLEWEQETVWLPVVQHHGHTIDFHDASFADDTSGNHNESDDGLSVADERPPDDPDAADLPDSAAYDLRDHLEVEGASNEHSALEDQLGRVYWVQPSSLHRDMGLVDALRSPSINEPPSHHQYRKAHATDSSHDRCIEFCPQALERLSRRTERLNDVTVNAGALLLQQVLSHERFPRSNQARACAIFSSFDIHLARYNRSTEDVWRRTKEVKYWEKSIWFFPIHRNEPSQHWVLGVVYPWHKHLYLFDSLASDLTAWKSDIQDILFLLTKLTTAAVENGNSIEMGDVHEFTVQPLILSPVQKSSFSCGLWVLAAIAAVLRGNHITGASETEIAEFRTVLYKWALTLPVR